MVQLQYRVYDYICPSTSTLEGRADEDDFLELTYVMGTATVTVARFIALQRTSDGAVIDPDTGTITGGLINSEYFVDYTTDNECPLQTIHPNIGR